ncbi:photosynthetic complex assembly protein PuhC [Marivita hallyeonensis]|uniref:Putative photosynthetic complex assembly protein n=1 Tax=Marivita hallyeonensis TaxID=996342 RepID=A0A1M5UH51_9RHOB|nr:photosynthetic complex assembly protein PuhC [Marivita hallyeonensis]SHH62382.1 putative photosynthetic complex assembly protein [Marivita hallyeonensis]
MTTNALDKPRIHATEKELVPRMLVRAMFAMVMICLIMVSVYTWLDGPAQYTAPDSPVVIEKTLYLEGNMSGSAKVYTEDRALIAEYSPEEGGFLSGMWRVLQRERTKARVALDGPVIVRARENNRLEIFDPSTGWGADLMGFGADNSAAFAKLLK